jgi:hypothetical protein
MNSDNKRQQIEKRLSREIFDYDPAFKALIVQLSHSDKQLDNVISMLDDYSISGIGRTKLIALAYVNSIDAWGSVCVFATFTFHPDDWHWSSKYKEIGKSLDRKASEAKHRVKVLFENLNKAVLPKKSWRNGQRLRQMSVLGGANGVIEPHYHSIIEKPEHLSIDDFSALLGQLWHGNVDCKLVDSLFGACLYLQINKQEAGDLGENLSFETMTTFKKVA